MLQLTWELFVQFELSNLCGYQFVSQEILYSLSLQHTSLYDQYVMGNVMNSLL
jgi:hypothetical protein